MSGYIGPLPVPQGIQRKQSFTATASQTTFNTNGYTDGNFINVYLNGVRLINGTDYTATNGSDIVLTTGASASDVLDFETFDTFELVNQTFENVTLKNPTHEDTDGGRESAVSFKGEQSGGEISTLAQIQASHDGTSDDQKGDLIFKTNDGSDNDAPTERMRIDSGGTVNITSPSNARALKMQNGANNSASQITFLSDDGTEDSFIRNQASTSATDILSLGTGGTERMRIDNNGKVGIGLTNPADYYGDNLVVSAPSEGGITIANQNTSGSNYLMFADGTTGSQAYRGYIAYNHSSPEDMRIVSYGHTRFYTSADGTNATERWRIEANGNLKAVVNGNGIDFSASEGGGASSSVLDDYEEGTWTPGMKAGSTTVSTTNAVGIYRKVGTMVMLQWSITRDDSTGHSGNLTIAGLPFSRATATNLITLAGGQAWLDNTTGNDRIGWPYVTSSNELVFTQDYRVDGGNRYFKAGNLTNGRPMYGSAHFIVA